MSVKRSRAALVPYKGNEETAENKHVKILITDFNYSNFTSVHNAMIFFDYLTILEDITTISHGYMTGFETRTHFYIPVNTFL